MTVRETVEALAPAGLAGIGGAAGYWLSGHPAIIITAAVLGAAAGTVLFGPEHPRAKRGAEALPRPPERKTRLAIEALLESLPAPVILIGRDRSIVHANEEAVALFGLPGSGDLPVSVLRVRRLLDGIGNTFAQDTPTVLDFSMSRTTDIYLKAHVRPMPEDGGVLVAIEDHSQMRRAIDSHRDFVANASHELKTPLAAVSGIIETLLGHARDDPEATERFLELLDGQTARMTRLIEDLLSLNRVEINERVMPDEPQEMVGLLSEVVDALRPIAEVSDVRISYTLATGPIIARADRDEVSQLFRNLIDNAIKYGGAGTEVEISTRVEEEPTGTMVAVSVRDEGPGIAREHLPRLTERFYRVNVKRSREKGGTGLGLAICKHIANRHRGRLEIQSRVGEGSVFTVYLPVASLEGTVHLPAENRTEIA